MTGLELKVSRWVAGGCFMGQRCALSGRPFPANGVMTYIPGNNNGSYLETCTLPDNAHTTCTALLNDFVARYRDR